MNITRRAVTRVAVRGAAAWLLAAPILGAVVGSARAERVYFPAQGSQNGFTKACREAGAAPKREGTRVVSCTRLENDGSAQRVTCNFKTNQCWRA